MYISGRLLIFTTIVDWLLEDFGCADFGRADVTKVSSLSVLTSTILSEKILSILDHSVDIDWCFELCINIHLAVQCAKYLIVYVSHCWVSHPHQICCRLAVKRKIILCCISDLLIGLIRHKFHWGFLFVAIISLLVQILVDILQLVKHCGVKSF